MQLKLDVFSVPAVVQLNNTNHDQIKCTFLITIFIGGFAFHILWEAKSRYIIPYIVVLIPVAAMNIHKFGIKKQIDNHIA